MAIPKEGYFELERGRYGPIFPRTPACYGFSIIAKVKEGREEAVRAYGKTIEETIADSPEALAPLRLHYLRWVLFDVGSGLHFQYQGIFDTDFDKYTEDAVALFSATGITTVFTNLEGFPEDWKENPDAFVKFVREHQYPSFLEYGEYPYVTADEIKKALRLKAAFSTMLDQMQYDARVRRHPTHPADPHPGDHRPLRIPVVRHARGRPRVADRAARQGPVGGGCAGHDGQLGSLGHVGVHVEWPSRARRA